MKRLIIKVLTATGVSLAACAIAANEEFEEPTGVLQREQALGLALLHNPDLAASAADASAAVSRTRQAGLLPNPELGLDVGEYDRAGQGFDSAEVGVGLTQVLELGGKRHHRTHMARAEGTVAEWDFESKRLEVRAFTAQRFVEVLAAQQRLELARSTIDTAEQTHRAVIERVNAGKEPPLQASKATAELEMARIGLAEVETELRGARRALAAMWGSGEPRFASVAGDLESVPAQIPSLENARAGLASHPALARWDAELERHRYALSSERAARLPDLEVSVGYTQFEEDNTDAFGVGVAVPLPLFDRNQGNIAAAQHELTRGMAERRAAEIGLAGELMEAHAGMMSSRQRVDALRAKVVPAMQEAFEAAHEGYQQGKFGFLEMLDAQRGLFEARGALVDALAAFHISLAEVERLTATELNDKEENE